MFVVFHQSGTRLTAKCEFWRTGADEGSIMLNANISASVLHQKNKKSGFPEIQKKLKWFPPLSAF